MTCHLYVVIYEQGTVKVGATTVNPRCRISAHRSDAARWDVKVTKTFVLPVPGDELRFLELVLCGYCAKDAIPKRGFEWFKFESADLAKKKLQEYFGRIQRNEFGEPQIRNLSDKSIRDGRFAAAMRMIRDGMTAEEAAARLQVGGNMIMNRREYKQFMQQQGGA